MSERSVVVSGSLQQHQVRQWLDLRRNAYEVIQWTEQPVEPDAMLFTITAATDEQWDRIQAWVKKVTG